MSIKEFDLVGYEEYEKIFDDLQSTIFEKMQSPNYYFLSAITEAVLNAALYSEDGLKKTKIRINLNVSPDDIKVCVCSLSKPTFFDAKAYQKKLLELYKDPVLKELKWGEYTRCSEQSRGFWLMLTGVDYLVMDYLGRHISLCARVPFEAGSISLKIEDLVPKFYVMDKNGVIS